MTFSDPNRPDVPKADSGEVAEELVRLGIITVPATYFEWGGYRYSNAHDAIAAARRAPR